MCPLGPPSSHLIQLLVIWTHINLWSDGKSMPSLSSTLIWRWNIPDIRPSLIAECAVLLIRSPHFSTIVTYIWLHPKASSYPHHHHHPPHPLPHPHPHLTPNTHPPDPFGTNPASIPLQPQATAPSSPPSSFSSHLNPSRLLRLHSKVVHTIRQCPLPPHTPTTNLVLLLLSAASPHPTSTLSPSVQIGISVLHGNTQYIEWQRHLWTLLLGAKTLWHGG